MESGEVVAAVMDGVQRFEDLGLSRESLAAVRALGWERPTPVQCAAVPPALEGRDIVGVAQTGTGKTGAFMLGIIERLAAGAGPQALVLCPTRELAQQVAEAGRGLCRGRALQVVAAYGGVPLGKQIRAFQRGADIVVGTPGRLIDHLHRRTLSLASLLVLVLDEADRMLDMGFRPQIEEILRHVPRVRQTMLFSATMPNGVHALALQVTRDPVWLELAPRGTTAGGLEQVVYMVRPQRKTPLLVHLLRDPSWDQVLVFTRTKTGADALVARLEGAAIPVGVLHGDRDMRERTRALDLFAQGHVRVLVATDLAQRGLDIEGISHVVNYDVPMNPEDYVHRIGRTARAGATGVAVTFVTPAELGHLKAIEHMLGRALERVDLPEFGYGPGPAPRRAAAGKRVRGTRALGTRRADELSEEELAELLKVG